MIHCKEKSQLKGRLQKVVSEEGNALLTLQDWDQQVAKHLSHSWTSWCQYRHSNLRLPSECCKYFQQFTTAWLHHSARYFLNGTMTESNAQNKQPRGFVLFESSKHISLTHKCHHANRVRNIIKTHEDLIWLQRLLLCQKWLDTQPLRKLTARELKQLLESKWLFTSHSVHLSDRSSRRSLTTLIGSDKERVGEALCQNVLSASHRFVRRSKVKCATFACYYIQTRESSVSTLWGLSLSPDYTANPPFLVISLLLNKTHTSQL